MGNKKDLNNRKRTTKKANSTYKLQVIFTQGEKVVKDTYKGKRPELHENITHSPPRLHSQCFPKSSPVSPSGLIHLIFLASQHSNITSRHLQFPSHAGTSRPLDAVLNKAWEPCACNGTPNRENGLHCWWMFGGSPSMEMCISKGSVWKMPPEYSGKTVSRVLYYFRDTV